NSIQIQIYFTDPKRKLKISHRVNRKPCHIVILNLSGCVYLSETSYSNFSVQGKMYGQLKTSTVPQTPYGCSGSVIISSNPDLRDATEASNHLSERKNRPFRVLKPKKCFVCTYCGKVFERAGHLERHLRKRTFWCSVCGKSFQCSSHLSIHHRTHTGEKPYGCGQCGKRFTQQSSLRVHQRTHSGERPYSCSQCGKSFIMMHHLKRHRIIHTYSCENKFHPHSSFFKILLKFDKKSISV
uniref:C2H2-type domain-containing protein n=1 Tax=Xiphophorus maculatus TaxID=8083 RepID=A0A3B5R341_XIPMA